MADVNKSTKDELQRIYKNVKTSMMHFQDNAKNFNHMKHFCFISTLSTTDKSNLEALKFPTLEFNIVEPHISRLLGDFSVVNPQFKITTNNPNAVNVATADIVSSIVRKILYDSQSASVDTEIYKDILGGGYSVMRVYTEYAGERTFDQDIKLGRVNDPTMCGFDPCAEMPHKGDGRYCFEAYPISKEDFESQFPDIETSGARMAQGGWGGLDWKWSDTQGNAFYNIVDYFEFEEKRIRLNLMSENPVWGFTDSTVLTDTELKALVAEKMQPGSPFIEPVPRQSEWRMFSKVVRYRIWGGGFLENKKHTDFDYLPLIFMDCNSTTIKKKQTTRAYVQQAVGVQRSKNISGNIMLAEVQGLRRTRMLIAEESLPTAPELMQAWTNPQAYYGAATYKAKDDDGSPNPSPQIFPAAPIPPEIAAAFNNMDGTMQGVLGSYQAQQGNLPANISSDTLTLGIGQANSAAKPPIINYTASLNQVIKVIMNMIPKLYVTPRTMPVVDASGTRTYTMINNKQDPNSNLMYEPNCLDLYVTSGVSFEAQKKEALNTLVQLSANNPAIGSLINGKGLPILLENLDIKGGDKLQVLAQEQIDEMQAQKEAMKNNPPPPPPEIMMQERALAIKEQEMQMNGQLKMEQIQADREKVKSEETIQVMKFQLELARMMSERESLETEMSISQDANERERMNQQIKIRQQSIDQMKIVMDGHIRMIDHHGKMMTQQ